MASTPDEIDLLEAVTAAAGQERAAVVAYLRAKAAEVRTLPFATASQRALARMARDTLTAAASSIEQGGHHG